MCVSVASRITERILLRVAAGDQARNSFSTERARALLYYPDFCRFLFVFASLHAACSVVEQRRAGPFGRAVCLVRRPPLPPWHVRWSWPSSSGGPTVCWRSWSSPLNGCVSSLRLARQSPLLLGMCTATAGVFVAHRLRLRSQRLGFPPCDGDGTAGAPPWRLTVLDPVSHRCLLACARCWLGSP